ncbi:GAF domain-containing protein [Paenibacillus sp. NPDC058174]|uniref:GAF domain-containing sensor histidine kinase n=1 Tax=Paenibacillus sp. NPDC058174 TaxID=3346366 RepID=UPI0036D951EB
MSREIRSNELTALKEIAEMLNTSNEMDLILNDVLVKLLDVTGFSTGWIFLLDDDTPGNECAASHNLPEALTVGNYALMCGEDCWCVERYRERQLHQAVNIIECRRINYAVAHQIGSTEGISHHATVPLTAGKDRFGLLNVAQAGKDHFNEEELALLQAVAFQIGTAIKRIRLYQAQEKNAMLYAKLGDVIQALNAIQNGDQLPLQAVKLIGEAFNWPHVSFFIYERGLSLRAHYTNGRTNKDWRSLELHEAGPVSTAFHENSLVIESNGTLESCHSLAAIGIPPYVSAAAIPLRIRNRTIGVLFVSSPSSQQFDELHEDFMYSLGDHFTLSMENLRVYEQRRELARMEERNRMARDLHDSVIQKVFSLSFLAKGAETVLSGSGGAPVVKESLQEIQQLAQEALKEMRGLIWQLHPPGLENGLLPALKQYGQGMNLDVYAQVDGVKELPRAVEEALWRIGQEALNNVRKHAGTTEAYVRLVKTDLMASLEIMDKGRGFSMERKKPDLTMGMMSMRERAESLNGQLTINSGKGKPTIVRAEIPITAAEEICSENEGLV